MQDKIVSDNVIGSYICEKCGERVRTGEKCNMCEVSEKISKSVKSRHSGTMDEKRKELRKEMGLMSWSGSVAIENYCHNLETIIILFREESQDNQIMTNHYGVDTDFFTKELKALIKSLPNRPADELYRCLTALARVVEPTKDK